MQMQQRRVVDNEPSVTICNLLQSINETSLKISTGIFLSFFFFFFEQDAAPTSPTVVSTILSKH